MTEEVAHEFLKTAEATLPASQTFKLEGREGKIVQNNRLPFAIELTSFSKQKNVLTCATNICDDDRLKEKHSSNSKHINGRSNRINRDIIGASHHDIA